MLRRSITLLFGRRRRPSLSERPSLTGEAFRRRSGARSLCVALAGIAVAVPTFAAPVAAQTPFGLLPPIVVFPNEALRGDRVKVMGSGCAGGEVIVSFAGGVTPVQPQATGLWEATVAVPLFTSTGSFPTGEHPVFARCRTGAESRAYPFAVLRVVLVRSPQEFQGISGGALAVLLLSAGGNVAAAIQAATLDNDDLFFGETTVVLATPVTTTVPAPTTTAPTLPPTTTTTAAPATTTTVPATTTTVPPTTTTVPPTTTTVPPTTTTSPYVLASMRTAAAAVPEAPAPGGATTTLRTLALPVVEFQAGEEVRVSLAPPGAGATSTLASATADDRGAMTAAFAIPAVATSGIHVLQVRGTTSGVGFTVPLTLRGDDVRPAPAELPRTGGSPLRPVLPALLLLALGVLLVRRSSSLT